MQDRRLACAASHCFDRAKQGYWNLLQPQDSKSKSPGDRDEAVEARERWVQRGVMNGLIESLLPWVSGYARESSPPVMDLGCGTGFFGKALYGGNSAGFCGIDLSKKAIKLASRAWTEATWVLANADRVLPAKNDSVGQVISLFGRRPYRLVKDALAADGTFVVAVPGPDDLIELREAVQKQGTRRERRVSIIDQANECGLTLIDKKTWRENVQLDQQAMKDALAMTYRGARHSQQQETEQLCSGNVTLNAELMLFRKSSAV